MDSITGSLERLYGAKKRSKLTVFDTKLFFAMKMPNHHDKKNYTTQKLGPRRFFEPWFGPAGWHFFFVSLRTLFYQNSGLACHISNFAKKKGVTKLFDNNISPKVLVPLRHLRSIKPLRPKSAFLGS